MNNPFFAMQPLLEQIILGMIQEKKQKALSRKTYSQRICTSCGLSFQDFLDSGRLGCPNCYVSFRDELKPLLRRIHGTIRHSWSVKKSRPGMGKNRVLERLRKELAAAVEEEEFEKAAVLRDRMREMERHQDETA